MDSHFAEVVTAFPGAVQKEDERPILSILPVVLRQMKQILKRQGLLQRGSEGAAFLQKLTIEFSGLRGDGQSNCYDKKEREFFHDAMIQCRPVVSSNPCMTLKHCTA